MRGPLQTEQVARVQHNEESVEVGVVMGVCVRVCAGGMLTKRRTELIDSQAN